MNKIDEIEIDDDDCANEPCYPISERQSRIAREPGAISNALITARNNGVRHQFIDDIGGCSANYR